jgi:hypothetical protein
MHHILTGRIPALHRLRFIHCTNHGKDIPYMHHTSFLFVFLISFRSSIDLGLLVGPEPPGAKKISR